MLFVAFGATVLVPLLVGIDPSIALFGAGVGTLIFHFISKNMVPAFLGSSFIFLAPMILGAEKFGFSGVLSGIIACGLFFILVAFLIKKAGTKVINKLFPPVVIGSVIMIIGLSLASTAIEMSSTNWFLAIFTLAIAIYISLFGKRLIKLLPIIIAIFISYILAYFLGYLDFTPITNAAWISLPSFTMPTFNISAIILLLPVAIAPILEHIGDVYAISKAAKKDFIKNPGIKRTLLGDGVATVFAGFIGGLPLTTYSEVTGAISLTKMTNPQILRISAVFAIILSFIGKISGFLLTIPDAILGGVMILLFGMIIILGLKTFYDRKVNFYNPKNTIIIGVMLTLGAGGAIINFSSFSLEAIGIASIVGIILNQIIPNNLK